MVGAFVKGKVCVFIDAANIFYSQRTLKWKISYERLRRYFEKECSVVNMFVYTATDASRPVQKTFVDMLQKIDSLCGQNQSSGYDSRLASINGKEILM